MILLGSPVWGSHVTPCTVAADKHSIGMITLKLVVERVPQKLRGVAVKELG